MNREEATRFVIRELGKHRSDDEVIRELTERTGCSWDEARYFVHYVKFDHRTTIAARQSPLLVFLAIITIIIGGALVLGNTSVIIYYLRLQMLPGYNHIALLCTGLAMIAGATIGLWQSIRAMWK